MAKDTRRGHGEGTKYQRADGYWIGQITIGRDDEGKQERKTFSAKTEKELVAKMKEYQYQQMRGELPKTNTMSLGEWLTSWLENYKKPNLRQTTYENYDTMIKTHILKSAISKTQVQKLTTDQIQKFMKVKAQKGKIVIVKEEVEEQGQKVLKEKKTEQPLSSRTVNLIHFLIQAALEQAKKNNMVSNNAASNCELYKDTKKEVIPLGQEEVLSLLKSLKDNRMYTAVLLDLYTGMRRGELLALRWDNVNLDEGIISIVENLVRVKGGSKIHKPKTKSSIRTINIPEKVKNALVIHKELQVKEKGIHKEKQEKAKEKGKVIADYCDLNLVFCQTNGKRIQPRNFQRMFDGWIVKAGLPEATRFHDLRHTFATNMITAGVDIKTVQSFTGHSDSRTLLDTYSHFVSESQRAAAKTMNGLIPDI
jgi:integrase